MGMGMGIGGSVPCIRGPKSRRPESPLATSRTFFPANSRSLADFEFAKRGISKSPLQCAAKTHHRKNPANSLLILALRSPAKSRGKKNPANPLLIPGISRNRSSVFSRVLARGLARPNGCQRLCRVDFSHQGSVCSSFDNITCL